MPALIAWDQEFDIGKLAEIDRSKSPWALISEMTRIIGRARGDPMIEHWSKDWPFVFADDSPEGLTIAITRKGVDSRVPATQIAEEFIKDLVRRVNEVAGIVVSGAIVSVPTMLPLVTRLPRLSRG